METIKHILKSYFGYDSFRPMQEEIITHVLEHKDSLVLMPTGGGKSICFQIPALMMEGLTIVVSPLISLMKDQVEALKACGVMAEAVNSSNDESLNRNIINRCGEGKVKILYISPERLVGGMLSYLQRLNIAFFAIDEAHCISGWGHDFRPEYTQLGQLKELFPNVPIMALTATADKLTKQDILTQLHIEDAKVFISRFDRPNLSLDVRRGYAAKDKLRTIVNLIKRHPGESGIIYCLAKKTTESLAEKLKKEGISVGVYHAGLPTSERNKIQDDFTNDRIQVICATIAFGMGIDKSNVRFVVHYNLPKSIENYYQEIGRGGRDGLPCETILFYNLQDIITLRRFADESGQRDINLDKLQRMQEYAEAQVCRRRILLNYFGETSDKSCGNCDVCKTPPQTFDGTILVQKALSAIMRTGEQVGFTVTIDILKGSFSPEVIAKGYGQLKTFAAGRDVPARDWHDYLLQMLQMGFIEIAYHEDHHLHVTPLGQEVLKGVRSVQLAVIHKEDFSVKGRRQKMQQEQVTLETTNGSEENKELFERLKVLRRQIADANNWAAYVVMSDKSLHLLASNMPTTLLEFGNTFGIGQRKCEAYGQQFIDIIKEYAPQKEELPFPDVTPVEPTQEKKKKEPKNYVTFNGVRYDIPLEIWKSIEWRKTIERITRQAYWNYEKDSEWPLVDYVPADIESRTQIVNLLSSILQSAFHLSVNQTTGMIHIPQKFDYDQEGNVVSLPSGSFDELLSRFRLFVIQHNRYPFMDGEHDEIALRKWYREVGHELIPVTDTQKQLFDYLAVEFENVPKNRGQLEKADQKSNEE